MRPEKTSMEDPNIRARPANEMEVRSVFKLREFESDFYGKNALQEASDGAVSTLRAERC